MKKNALIILSILTGITFHAFGQKLEENKKDEFTNSMVKRTSWETLYTTLSANAYFRISLVDNFETFDLKYQDGTVYSIEKDQEIMFKLENGDVISLPNLKFQISCKGCGAKGFVGSGGEGIQVSYRISKEQIDKLKAGKVVKVRIGTTSGYLEHDVKDKNAEKITGSLNLL